MKLSKDFFYTIKENIADEDSISGKFLVKSGMIKKVSNGIYLKTSLGLKVIKNVEKIIRKNMNMAGANEVSMPALLPIELFEKTGRKTAFGQSMFELNDRYNRKYALGPTHEEMFVDIAMNKVKSYRDLPFTIYQIGNKYRDEIRPRLGLIRTREFTMKDAYSFDKDEQGLDESYNKMFKAYNNIFNELGIDYTVVKSDTGAMGGLLSEEFQAITDIGEDTIVFCNNCDYSSNIEICKCKHIDNINNEKKEQIKKIYTPNSRTINEVTNCLNLPISKFVKTMIYQIDGKFYACMVEADREINETKLAKIFNAINVELANDEDVQKITNAEVGYAGPIGLKIPIIMDTEIKNKKNFIVGANETNYHLKNVNLTDFDTYIIEDIKKVKEGDLCPECGERLALKKGIEVGNTFKLGTKYSESLGLNYLGSDNKNHPVVMGCYGIGVERIISAIVEQNHDKNGIIWPINIAPYKVSIIVINMKDKKQINIAEKIYNNLNKIGIDTLLDDRNERPGVKFNDMDLIGIPIRLTIGKKIEENIIEIKLRKENQSKECKIENILKEIEHILNNKICE